MSMKFVSVHEMAHTRPTKKMPAPRRDTLTYVIRLLNRFLTDQRHSFLLALAMLIAEAVTSIFEAYPLAYLIDYLNGADLLSRWGLPALISPLITTAAVLTLGIVLIAMVNNLGDSLAEIYLAQVGRTLGYNMRLTLYRHLQRLSLAFHDQRHTGDILTRITGDVSEIESFIIGSLSDIAGSLLVLVGTLAYLAYNSWQVALVVLVIVPVMALVSNYFSKQIKAATKEQRAREGDLASATQEMLTSIRVIQTYGQGGQELQRFADYNQKNADVALHTAGIQARFSWVVNVSEALAISIVIWLGLWLINGAPGAPVISPGILVMLIFQIKGMFKPTRKIIKEWNTIGKIYASVERIGELLDRQPAVADAPNATLAPAFHGHIEFQQVSFSYQPDAEEAKTKKGAEPEVRQALQDVGFQVAPGEVLALVGHTGAGKSTVIQMLSRLYDPTSGRVLIDGVDIRRFTLDSLRSQIGVVLQEMILFNGSVAENIAYGRPNATRDEIMQAAVQANAHSFIEKMPQGYDTMLGERGANLSGGQRQRITIARAFIRNAPILILDEPTSGLDAESAELVLLALRMLMKGKTTIIVSHDFKLVRQANKIVVLKDGRIEEMGTHRELLTTQGIYANLYVKQFGQGKVEDEKQEGSLYDLMRSPAFQYRWPAIGMAFQAEKMQAQLQAAFFGADNAAYTITKCKPGKASYLEQGGCVLRYELELTHTPSGETQSSLLLARIFGDKDAAQLYLRQRLAPLATKMEGRPEVAPFVGGALGPVALLDELNMVVSVFPLDGELPALIAATDRQQMLALFQEALIEEENRRFLVEDCSIEAGHYGRQHRCVLRYEVTGRWADANGQGDPNAQLEHRVVYGKVAADDRCKLVGMVVTALQRRLQVRSTRRFRIPRIVGYHPNLRLILLEAIPGAPQVAELIEARLTGKAATRPGALTVEQALKDCAQIAVGLHKVEINLGPARTFGDEIASLEAQLPPVQEFSLALAMQLQITLKRLQQFAEQAKPLPRCFSHGDYTYTQLIFDDVSCGLVDFDTSCQAEPALDLGQFLAYLRLTVRKSEQGVATKPGGHRTVTADELCTQFLSAYMQAAGYRGDGATQLFARAAVYEIISLMRIALHSWQKLKGNRLELVVDLLEERMKCLAQLNQPTN